MNTMTGTDAGATAAAIAAGCACTPAWPALAVTRDDGTAETVLASDTPGPLARLYYAHCTRCGVQYPGPFRLPPRAACHTGRTGPSRAWQNRCPATENGHAQKESLSTLIRRALAEGNR
ncbi:hypothetical protein CU254_42265 (plasmid) [Amycolatopsis sp. AA4]|nr:hypothetical protein CU254_42265 [Amycolatopsis sp. AA4]